jgi:hypothetical protein
MALQTTFTIEGYYNPWHGCRFKKGRSLRSEGKAGGKVAFQTASIGGTRILIMDANSKKGGCNDGAKM